MFDWIEDIDHSLFLFINGHNAPWADEFFYAVSLKWVWIPVYLFVAWLLIKNFGKRNGAMMITVVVISVIVVDIISTQLFKEIFQRYRPCHNLDLAGKVHLYNNDCGGIYGFVSSHAANFATWCTLGFLLLRKKIKYIGILFLICFLLVAYSRIYLGRHYPLDVWGGMLLGVAFAYASYLRLNKALEKSKNK